MSKRHVYRATLSLLATCAISLRAQTPALQPDSAKILKQREDSLVRLAIVATRPNGSTDGEQQSFYFARALELAQRRGDVKAQLARWSALASTWRFLAYDDSVAYANRQQLAIARQLGDSLEVAGVYLWMARDVRKRKLTDSALADVRTGARVLTSFDTATATYFARSRLLERLSAFDTLASQLHQDRGASDSATLYAGRAHAAHVRGAAIDSAWSRYERAAYRRPKELRDSLGSYAAVKRYLDAALRDATAWRFDVDLVVWNAAAVADSLGLHAEARQYNLTNAETKAAAGDYKGAAESVERVAFMFDSADRNDSSAFYLARAVAYALKTKDNKLVRRYASPAAARFSSAGRADSLFKYGMITALLALADRDSGAVTTALLPMCGRRMIILEIPPCRLLERVATPRHDTTSLFRAVRRLGELFSMNGQHDSALAHGRRAVAIATAARDSDSDFLARTTLGRIFGEMRQRDSAQFFLRGALSLARTEHNRRFELVALGSLAVEFFRRARNRAEQDSSIAYDRLALRVATELHDTAVMVARFQGLGHSFKEQERADSAQRYFSAALALARAGKIQPDHFLLGNGAYIFEMRGMPDSALAYHRLALQLDEREGYTDGIIEGLIAVGDAHYALGRTDSALVFYQRGLATATSASSSQYLPMANGRLASTYERIGRTDSAAVFRAAGLALRRPDGRLEDDRALLADEARAQERAGHVDSALVLHRRLLADAVQFDNQLDQANDHIQLGDDFRLTAKADSADAHYRAALELFHRTGARTSDDEVLARQARLMADRHRADSAVVLLKRALAYARDIHDPTSEQSRLEELGDLYLDEPDIRNPETAASYYEAASLVERKTSNAVAGDLNRVSIEEQAIDLYGSWALSLLAQSDKVSERDRSLAALAAIERGRSRELLDLLRRGRGASDGGRPALAARATSVLAEGRDFAAHATATGRTRTVVSYFVTADTLFAWWLYADGSVTVRRLSLDTIPISSIVRALRSRLGVNGADSRAVPVLDDADPAPAQSRGVDDGPVNAASADSVLRRLSPLLLPPGALPAAGGELVVIPYGIISLVPFPALPLGSAGEPLSARVALRFAPSIRSLQELDSLPRVARGANRSALVVANPTMPTVNLLSGPMTLGRLAAADSEGNWIATRLGTKSLRDSLATKAAVVRGLHDAQIVHFATHGYAFASEGRARDSFIALAPTPSDNGILTVGEILDDDRFTMSADLVVLSACQTGLGNRRRAEGTVGLQRAFLAKGARSVLVSLWSVDDRATKALMQHFYTHWLDDPSHPSKGEALRLAQEDIRTDRTHPEWKQPRYWAAFQLVGGD